MTLERGPSSPSASASRGPQGQMPDSAGGVRRWRPTLVAVAVLVGLYAAFRICGALAPAFSDWGTDALMVRLGVCRAVAAIYLLLVLIALRWRGVFIDALKRPLARGATVLAGATAALAVIMAAGLQWSTWTARGALVSAGALLLVGLVEEVAFRGILVRGLEKSSVTESGLLLITSLVFGLVHALNGLTSGEWLTSAVQAGAAVGTGVGLFLLRRATGGLVVPILVHALWDFGATGPKDLFGGVLVNIGALVSLAGWIFLFLALRDVRRQGLTHPA